MLTERGTRDEPCKEEVGPATALSGLSRACLDITSYPRPALDYSPQYRTKPSHRALLCKYSLLAGALFCCTAMSDILNLYTSCMCCVMLLDKYQEIN